MQHRARQHHRTDSNIAGVTGNQQAGPYKGFWLLRTPRAWVQERQRPLSKPTSSRPSALLLQSYSSVLVWRGTEGGGVDAHRERDHKEGYLTPGNKREGAYGCCLHLIASQNTSKIAKLTAPILGLPLGVSTDVGPF